MFFDGVAKKKLGLNPDIECNVDGEHTGNEIHLYYKGANSNMWIYGQCRNYRTEVEEDEGTVIYRTLLFYNSVFLGRYEKKCI